MREEGSGWLGTSDDDAGATAFSLGEEQLAKAMAAGGGLGLAKVIASGLASRRAAEAATDQDVNEPAKNPPAGTVSDK